MDYAGVLFQMMFKLTMMVGKAEVYNNSSGNCNRHIDNFIWRKCTEICNTTEQISFFQRSFLRKISTDKQSALQTLILVTRFCRSAVFHLKDLVQCSKCLCEVMHIYSSKFHCTKNNICQRKIIFFVFFCIIFKFYIVKVGRGDLGVI